MNRITQNLDQPNVWEPLVTLGEAADLCDDHRRYDANGNVVTDEPTTPDVLTFDGRSFDPTTAAQWNLNRHFDPQQGRWTSEAPIAFNGDDENLRRFVSE